MSGERLREAAVAGDADLVRTLIGFACNVCSADTYGLTALHYSVWNGNLDCVKFIASNPWGVDASGTRCSVLDLQSVKGYTALHLACMECDASVGEDVIRVLLVCGADSDATDRLGKTALDYAEASEDPRAKETFLSFLYLDAEDVDALTAHLRDKFTIADTKRWGVHSLDVNFEVPAFVLEDLPRRPCIPRALRIHEEHILPLIEEGHARRGVGGIRCLEFAKGQADCNQSRRAALLEAGDSSWTQTVASANAK